ncbi:MAG: putative aminopeptidase, partial [Bryobacterales bacterium]|nr:putative aminopeptidase [Bryobacterales bacterium]
MLFSICRASRWARRGWALALATSLAAYTAAITPDRKATLDRISAQSLQGHVWFLASDLLEGRDTPSRGLDIAAEYIASQFRRAGLKPVGDDGYFQTAHFMISEQSLDGAELTLHAGERNLRIGKSEMRILSSGKAEFSDITPLKINLDDVNAESVEGKFIVVVTKRRDAVQALAKLKP